MVVSYPTQAALCGIPNGHKVTQVACGILWDRINKCLSSVPLTEVVRCPVSAWRPFPSYAGYYVAGEGFPVG